MAGMAITLVAFKKDGTRRDIPLKSGDFTIGRKPDADLRLAIGEVSREHCRISVNGNKVIIRDLNSSNGTYVNHHRVSEATLGPGDEINVGPVTFVVQVDGNPANVQPKPPEMSLPPTATGQTDMQTRVAQPRPAAGMATPAAAQKPAAAEEELDVEDLSDFDIEDLGDLDLTEGGEAGEDDDIMQYLAEDDSSGEIPKKKK